MGRFSGLQSHFTAMDSQRYTGSYSFETREDNVRIGVVAEWVDKTAVPGVATESVNKTTVPNYSKHRTLTAVSHSLVPHLSLNPV